VAEPEADAAPPADHRWVRLVHREIVVLSILIGVTIAAFLATRAIAAGNERLRRQDAAAWYEASQRAAAAGQSVDAITALRRAVSKDPGNKRYRLALAAALAAGRQDEAARELLVGLRDAAPEDADVNIELARLEARRGDLTAARRYYQSALNVVWSTEQSDIRRKLRLELIHLLLAHGERSRALAELILLTANLPDQAAPQVEAGQLFLDAGDPQRALDRFTRALALAPHQGPALAGAGESAFALGDYARARRYLSAAPRGGRVDDLLAQTDLVLANDPMAPRLTVDDRTRRLLVDVQQVTQRAAACLPSLPADSSARAELAALQAEAAAAATRLSLRAMRESPDEIEAGLELVDRVEQHTQQGCAPLTARDRALMRIARLHGLEER
jgi:tetratricopeptide (TPR) repeat protein